MVKYEEFKYLLEKEYACLSKIILKLIKSISESVDSSEVTISESNRNKIKHLKEKFNDYDKLTRELKTFSDDNSSVLEGFLGKYFKSESNGRVKISNKIVNLFEKFKVNPIVRNYLLDSVFFLDEIKSEALELNFDGINELKDDNPRDLKNDIPIQNQEKEQMKEPIKSSIYNTKK